MPLSRGWFWREHFIALPAMLVAIVALASCSPRESKAPQPAEAPARVFAASSLTDVMKTMGDAYAATGQPAPVFNFAASSDLARQIEQGADADLFVSADEKWMDYLAGRDLIDPASRVNLATNRLVLIAPADRPFVFDPVPGADLAGVLAGTSGGVSGGGTLAIANPDGVPAGRYAREALEAIGAWAGVEGKAARAESVRAALRFVESGEAAAGIVYATDARAAGDKVVVVAVFPEASHTPITYPMAQVEGRDAATGFAAYLKSAPARAVFESAGFGPVRGETPQDRR